MQNERPYLLCIRCGICCISGPCGDVPLNDDGVCKHLIFHEKGGTTACELYNPDHPMWQSGCFLRTCSEIFPVLKQWAEERVGFQLKEK